MKNEVDFEFINRIEGKDPESNIQIIPRLISKFFCGSGNGTHAGRQWEDFDADALPGNCMGVFHVFVRTFLRDILTPTDSLLFSTGSNRTFLRTFTDFIRTAPDFYDFIGFDTEFRV